MTAIVISPEEEAASLADLKARIENSETLPREEKIELLASAVRNLPEAYIFPNQEAALPVYELAKEKLLSIPGYAEYFRDRLVEGKREGLKDPVSYDSFLRERMYIMMTLRHLKTPEVVEVLADLMDDDDETFLPVPSGTLGQVSALTLKEILKDGPDFSANYLEPWLEWRERVRAGEETFSIRGSDKRYNFQGEVRPPRPQHARRAPTPEDGDEQTDSGAGKAPRLRWLSIGLTLLALGAVYLFIARPSPQA